jgi:hypothetical protein
VDFVSWPGESDPGPYPIPLGAPIELGSDHHVLAIDSDHCVLYEPFNARFDEVAAGRTNHALRFTVNATQKSFVLPATHFASSNTDPNRPPMGLRLRLRADYDISRVHGQARVVLDALKRYGMIVADNGSNWYITGASDTRCMCARFVTCSKTQAGG